jgi:carboxypeptidase C (cathepsin A)
LFPKVAVLGLAAWERFNRGGVATIRGFALTTPDTPIMSDNPKTTADTADKQDPQEKNREKQAVEEKLQRKPVTSTGSVVVGRGRKLAYKTTCQFLPVVKQAFGSTRGEPEAALFTIAYELVGKASDDRAASSRPVCFAFNGGPGSASVWLHMGALGPKRVVVPDDASVPRPPFGVSDNPLTWLAHFDLVFIDPPHTGWSVCAGDEARKKMLSVDGDVDALVEVIRAWLTRHRRWGSVVYLAGESYGTTRGAAMADKLLDANVALAGLVLVSCAMDIQSLEFTPKNLLPNALFLPAFANTAQYHGRLKGPLGKSSEAARAAAEAFVDEDYLRALHAGAKLGGKERARIAQRVSELTGLSRALVEEKNLRIDDVSYFVELLRDEGRQVGRLDARATAPMAASRGRAFEFDPGIESLSASYAMASLAYMRDALGLDSEERYEFLSMATHKQWKWTRGEATGNSFCTTADDLARAMRRNPHLRVFVASGRYDLGTPYSASDWSLAQLDAPASVLSRIEHHYYDAGHMMYTRQADLEKMARDLTGWLQGH